MRCARCSAELPAQSQFCLRCGTPVHATASFPQAAPMAQATPLAPPNSNRTLLIALALLTLVVIGLSALVFKGHMVQAPSETNGGSLVQAPSNTNASPLVTVPGVSQPPPNMVQNPTEAAPQPTDISDYLAFLKDVENRKMALIKKQTAQTLSMYGNMLGGQVAAVNEDKPADQYLKDINKGNEDFAPQWDQLTKYFLTKTPPPSCTELQQKYYTHLGKMQSVLTKLHNALASATNPDKTGDALQALTEMQGSASAEADASAKAADDSLADVCDKYRLRKDFDIKTDPSGSTSLLH